MMRVGAAAGLGNDVLLKVALLLTPSYCLTPLSAALCSLDYLQEKGNTSRKKLEQFVKELCGIICKSGRTS